MNRKQSKYQQYVPDDRVTLLDKRLKDALKAVGSFLDPANQEAPVLGPIRKAMSSTPLGRPDYANPDLPVNERLANAAQLYGESFMGAHGGIAKPRLPVKHAFERAAAQEGAILDYLKRYDTAKDSGYLGYLDRNRQQADIELQPRGEKLWQQIYGGNAKAPKDWDTMTQEIRDAFRRMVELKKEGKLNYRRPAK